MPSEVILPRVDMDMSTGKISKWLVDDGAPVKKGQPLFEIETDKAAMEIEAEASGTVRTLAQAGADDVAVGSVVALIYREGESEAQASAAPAAAPAAASAAPEAQAAPNEDLLRDGQTDAAPPPASGAATAGPVAVSPEASNGLARDMQVMNGANGADRGRATPLARRLARERGHELSALNGTGPRGRVQASDVPGAVAAAAAISASVTPPVATPESIAVLRDGPTDVPPAVATPPAARPAPAPAPAARAPAPPPAPMPAPAVAPAATAALASRSAAGALATFRDGTGAPIVLLHGFGADRDGWRPFLQGYGGGRPVLALDLPGHGGAALAGAGDFEALVDGVEAALIEAGLGAFTLVGHSLGGAVAAAVAARGAVDLAALVLIAPAGLGPEINGGFVQGYLAATSEASLAPWLRELVADPSLVTPAFVRLSLRARDPVIASQRRIAEAVFPDGTQGFSIRADLARIACPVRVIFGTADRIVPARHAEGLPALVALHRLPGVGHLPQIEARETVQAIVAQAARG